jgi:hypothetical protein
MNPASSYGPDGRSSAASGSVRKRKLALAGNRSRRLTKTILLGSAVVFLAIAWLARELELDTAELRGYLITSLLLVAVVVVLAVLMAGVIGLVRRFLR